MFTSNLFFVINSSENNVSPFLKCAYSHDGQQNYEEVGTSFSMHMLSKEDKSEREKQNN